MTHFVSWPLRGTAVFPSSPEVVLFVDCNAWYVFVLPSLQMDGGLPGWGVASNNRAGGGAEKRRLSGQTGQLLCAADSFPQEDLRPWADTLQGENMQMFMHLSFIYCNLLLWAFVLLWCNKSLLQATGLHFRHTDNVIQWLNAMAEKGLPKVRPAQSPQGTQMCTNCQLSIYNRDLLDCVGFAYCQPVTWCQCSHSKHTLCLTFQFLTLKTSNDPR